jgi:aryl-alcohol dehydrogenase-like predicted oxidoreductase
MSLGSVYGSAGTLEDKVAFLEHAHAIGARFWDTADIYFDSEDAVGAWIKESGNRDDVFLATKFALHYSGMEQSVRSNPEYVKAACEKSLKRLGVETIDLYYCHRVDGVTPIEKTIEAMVELKEYVVLLIAIGISFTDHLLAKARSNTSDSLNALHRLSAVLMPSTPSLRTRWNTVPSRWTSSRQPLIS